jgi:tRNA threonylcarbamoyladenosine biosynthesis protein TsaB
MSAKFNMKILAVEFSSSRRSVAVVDQHGAPFGFASQTDGRDIFSLIEQALAEAFLEREDISVFAVGLGPGSYTGIRSAIALAQGWQIGRAIKTLGVSSVDCLALAAQNRKISGEVNIVIDAQRNEFYLARFEISAGAINPVQPLHLAPLSEIESLQGRGVMAGPDLAALFPSATNVYPDAATLGRLAAARSDFIPASQLAPIYLRATSFVKAPPPRIIMDRS